MYSLVSDLKKAMLDARASTEQTADNLVTSMPNRVWFSVVYNKGDVILTVKIFAYFACYHFVMIWIFL